MSNTVTRQPDNSGRAGSSLNVLAGIWLIISPWVLGFSFLRVPLWDALLVGIAVLILAAIRLGNPGAIGVSWVNVLLGCWLIISPFVLGFTEVSMALGNAVIMGFLVAIFGLWATIGSQTAVPPVR